MTGFGEDKTNITVVKVEKGTPLAEKLLEFVWNFSWEEVREHTLQVIGGWAFEDWETPFAALAGDRIVGMATIAKTDYYPLPEIFPWISTIFVTEEFRGQGICGKLIDFANDYAASLGFTRTYIPTGHTGLYEKYGYKYVKDIVNYGGDVDRLYAKDLSLSTVYSDGYYTFCLREGTSCLIAGKRRFTLTCHPFEPCLYITDECGKKTVVRNAFDPAVLAEVFGRGSNVTSATGREYDVNDFCRMVEYAADLGDTTIDEAEKVFGNSPKKKAKTGSPSKARAAGFSSFEEDPGVKCETVTDSRLSELLAEYPDLVPEYCIVKTSAEKSSPEIHRAALACACRKLFYDGKEQVWSCDLSSAAGRPVSPDSLFAAAEDRRGSNYAGAFMYPPWGMEYTRDDFDKVNSALFPAGKDALEVYEWTTDWSDYFDDGCEWWGALCFTVYDGALDRFVVILSSATD